MDRNLERSSPGAKAGLVAGICTVIFLAVAGAAFLLAQINGLRNEVTGVQRELTSAKGRIARLERKSEEPLISQSFNELAQKQGDVRQRAALELSREEAQLVRDYIKVPPAPPGTAPTIQIGAVVPPAMLMPLPQQVVDKAPKLVGARFATDRNGAIVIVRSGSRQADAVINPN